MCVRNVNQHERCQHSLSVRHLYVLWGCQNHIQQWTPKVVITKAILGLSSWYILITTRWPFSLGAQNIIVSAQLVNCYLLITVRLASPRLCFSPLSQNRPIFWTLSLVRMRHFKNPLFNSHVYTLEKPLILSKPRRNLCLNSSLELFSRGAFESLC